MKTVVLIISLFLLFVPLQQNIASLNRADNMEEELGLAYNNAKKGIYHGLNGIKKMKTKIDEKLIENDKLLADVKVTKEINGVMIESEGFYNSTSVKVTVFRSLESLLKDKYISE